MGLNKSVPPKDSYWDIFFWATPEYGARECCFTDRQLFAMPTLRGWTELPDIE